MSIDQPEQPEASVAVSEHSDGEEGPGNGKKEKSTARVIAEWVAVLAGALVLALILRSVLFQAYYIRFTSMEPTLGNGDRVLVNKLGYDIGDVDRGDLVVFERPRGVSGRQEDDLIKRVIALPGEVIAFVEGDVYIDGRRLHEPYLESSGITTGKMPSGCAAIVDEGCLIGAGEVFVMGDNRPNSTDSRTFGPISEDLIVGHAFLRLWPMTDFGRL
ncbi:MAG: signal peptidase I [Acidimicrobiia bacterium]|nr:signal peptidase I [Acidimicrobiia bacterium]MXZ77579.1 signal peptidase I [Acidimicrobiia bacterium]MYB09705.1 signal peptidase I [Acidimicrobiia bacterium]MYB75474.1 signal peptidase I [Acidimicrobiia bacterium]MYE74419.1 signal peptidase I [Acidimicrobiia bacterium]